MQFVKRVVGLPLLFIGVVASMAALPATGLGALVDDDAAGECEREKNEGGNEAQNFWDAGQNGTNAVMAKQLKDYGPGSAWWSTATDAQKQESVSEMQEVVSEHEPDRGETTCRQAGRLLKFEALCGL